MDEQPQIIKPQVPDSQSTKEPTSATNETDNTPIDKSFQPVVINPANVVGQPVLEPPPLLDTKDKIVVSGQKKKKPKNEVKFRYFHFNIWFILTTFFFLAIIAGVAVYVWFLPTRWANSYQSKIEPVYQQQVNQMTPVYQSINSSAFNNTLISEPTASQALVNISDILQTAKKSTTMLGNQNRFKLLPGTIFVHSVANANKEYQAMQGYVSDSQTFLSDYSNLVTYLQKLIQIGQTSIIPSLQTDFKNIGSSANNPAALPAYLQKSITDLLEFSNQVKGLNPSPDLEAFNNDLTSDLNGMTNSLEGILSLVQGNSSVNLSSSLGQFQTSVINYDKLVNSDPTPNLSTESTLLSQMSGLQAEKPVP